MRQARWSTPLQFEDTHDQLTSRSLFLNGFRGARTVSIVAQFKREQWATRNRNVSSTVNARIQRIAERMGVTVRSVREALNHVVTTTGHLTLYDDAIDAHKLIDRARADPDLRHHVMRVFRCYVDVDNEFTRAFFRSDEGYIVMTEFGIIENDDDGTFHVAEDLPRCQCCDGCVFPNENTARVYTAGDCGDWYEAHEGCVDDDSSVFRCDLTRYWFDRDCVEYAELDDTGDEVCIEACLQRRLIIESENDEGDTIYLRAGNRSGGRLAEYHRAPRPWLHSDTPIPNGYVGVELELGFKYGEGSRNTFLSEFVNSDGRHKDGPFVFERDGSLAGVPGGMEVISDPLPLFTGYQAKDAAWRKLLTQLYKSGAEGWKHRKLAGIHVNLCVREESDASLFKYASFIGNARAMSKFIAGRKKIFGVDEENEGYWRVEPYLLRGRELASRMESQFSHGKYSAVNRRPNRDCLETRIFGSNIRYEGFMACVEYCVAAMEFVRPLHVLDVSSPTIAGEFRNWLGSVHGRFPNLCARLGIVAHPRGSATPSTSRVVPALLAA